MNDSQRELMEIRRAERQQEAKKQKEKKDYFTFVTIVQTVLCLILIIVVAAISKSTGETGEKLRRDFASLMSWSIENTDSESVIKTLKEFLSEPLDLMPAFSPENTESEETTVLQTTAFENETDEDMKDETETTEEVETEAADETFESTDLQSENLSETTAQTDEAVGGEDIEVYEAADNTSFSPVTTTCAAVSPVNSKNYTSYFGYRINPITNEKSFHTGLDIAAPLGTKIKASYAGTVRKTGEDSHSGKYIILTHSDGFETFYCHCSEILAEEGAVIRQGETIALVGSTGWTTGPHLHFEVRKDGKRLNPLWVLSEDDV